MALGLDLSASRAKVAWARKHIKTFEREFDSLPNERKPYSFSVSEVNEDGWATIFITAKPVLDYCFGVMIGEAFHDLRCALDYIVTALVDKSPGAVLGRSHQFPIFKNEGYYKAKAGTVANPIGYLQGVVFGVQQIWDLQPFQKPGNERFSPLFIVNRFSNADKHRIITQARAIPRKVSSSIAGIALQHNGTLVEYRMLSGQPISAGDENKIEAYGLRFARPYPTYVRFNPEIGVSLEIATPPFDGEPLEVLDLDIFETCCEYISKVLDLFEKL